MDLVVVVLVPMEILDFLVHLMGVMVILHHLVLLKDFQVVLVLCRNQLKEQEVLAAAVEQVLAVAAVVLEKVVLVDKVDMGFEY